MKSTQNYVSTDRNRKKPQLSGSRKNRPLGVAITTGDSDGVGVEVSLKALFDIGPQPGVNFFLFRDHKHEKKQPRYFSMIEKKFARITFHDIQSALNFWNLLNRTGNSDSGFLFDIASKENAAQWVIASTRLCHEGALDSLITGPISKTLIRDSGYSFVGHTGLFRQLYPKRDFFMAFAGPKFNVILFTDHIALKDVEKTVGNPKLFASFLKAATEFHNSLGVKGKMALLGLNPHAGEKGVIGSFEEKLTRSSAFKRSLTGKSAQGKLIGPISADGAFIQSNWSKYSTYLAMYHDQGLIPFKLVHGQESGVHITLGLPFVRTSVDHGTAKDLFNKNRAVHLSMRDAILYNLKLTKRARKLR